MDLKQRAATIINRDRMEQLSSIGQASEAGCLFIAACKAWLAIDPEARLGRAGDTWV